MSEEITYNDDKINSTEEFHQSEIQDEQHSKLYWIQKNLRDKFLNWANSHKLFATLTVLFILILAFYLRTYYQPLALGFRKYFVLILVLLFIIWIVRRVLKKKKKIIRVLGNFILVGFIVLGYLYGPPVYRYVGLYYHYKTINKQEISDLPLTEQERIHPLNSIRTRLNQDGLPELSEATLPHIIIRKNGRLDFSMCVLVLTQNI
jgi:energy-coupling factor transporter transmembrane protein EcfT